MPEPVRLVAERLSAEAFAPFGHVVTAPPLPRGRVHFGDHIENARPHARANFSIVTVMPLETLPLTVTKLERHQFSSQSFIPIDNGGGKLVIVAPNRAGPDLTAIRAFVTLPTEGIIYRPNIWHHGLTLLDRPGSQAVLMWCDGTTGDEEFVDVPTFTVEVPPALRAVHGG